MWYEINISKNGRHVFATHERSIVDHHKLKEVYNVIKEKFPQTEGYMVNVTRYETRGEQFEPQQLDALIQI